MSLDVGGFHYDLRRLVKSGRQIQLANENHVSCLWTPDKSLLRPISDALRNAFARRVTDITKIIIVGSRRILNVFRFSDFSVS